MNSAEIENSSIPPGGDSTGSSASEHLASLDHEAASGEDRLAEDLYRDASAGADASEASAAAESAASALADSAQEKLSQATSALSEQIRKVSWYFENRGLEGVVGDARRLVQRNPGLFIAGGVAVGFALSRLLANVEQRRTGRRH
jgi:hypothetical protein